MRVRSFLLALVVFCLFNSCKRDIEVPAYIHINPIQFTVQGGQGTELQNIHHVGLYIDDNLEGIFEAPITVPILRKGQRRVDVRPFIKRLARQGVVLYSLANTYSTTKNLADGVIDTVSPVFTYESNVKYVWLEDFNIGTKSFYQAAGTLDTIEITNSRGPGVDTTKYAYMNLGTVENSFFEIETDDAFELPDDGRDVYIEFHYKTNIPFTVGLLGISPSLIITLPSVTPFETNGEWKKGYIYLTEELVNQPVGTKYKVIFRCYNGEETLVPEVYLDNLKLMYRE